MYFDNCYVTDNTSKELVPRIKAVHTKFQQWDRENLLQTHGRLKTLLHQRDKTRVNTHGHLEFTGKKKSGLGAYMEVGAYSEQEKYRGSYISIDSDSILIQKLRISPNPHKQHSKDGQTPL